MSNQWLKEEIDCLREQYLESDRQSGDEEAKRQAADIAYAKAVAAVYAVAEEALDMLDDLAGQLDAKERLLKVAEEALAASRAETEEARINSLTPEQVLTEWNTLAPDNHDNCSCTCEACTANHRNALHNTARRKAGTA